MWPSSKALKTTPEWPYNIKSIDFWSGLEFPLIMKMPGVCKARIPNQFCSSSLVKNRVQEGVIGREGRQGSSRYAARKQGCQELNAWARCSQSQRAGIFSTDGSNVSWLLFGPGWKQVGGEVLWRHWRFPLLIVCFPSSARLHQPFKSPVCFCRHLQRHRKKDCCHGNSRCRSSFGLSLGKPF